MGCSPPPPCQLLCPRRRSSTTSAVRSWSRCSRWISSTWRRRSTRSSCASVRAMAGVWGWVSMARAVLTHRRPSRRGGNHLPSHLPLRTRLPRHLRLAQAEAYGGRWGGWGVRMGGWGSVGGGKPLSDTLPPTSPPSCQVRTNVPSWCDRILWKSYPETHVNCNAYGELSVPLPTPRTPAPRLTPPSPSCLATGCTDDIVTSDHSPVFGSFEVGVTSQFVSKKGARAMGTLPGGPLRSWGW